MARPCTRTGAAVKPQPPGDQKTIEQKSRNHQFGWRVGVIAPGPHPAVATPQASPKEFPMRVFVIATLLAALAAPAVAGVHPAKGQPDVLETTVRFSDLDLNRVAGADLVLARIGRAARDVCGEAPSPRELARRARHRACVATATDTAVARLDAPLVTARHSGRDPAMLAEAR
jgi:UrcA family protein